MRGGGGSGGTYASESPGFWGKRGLTRAERRKGRGSEPPDRATGQEPEKGGKERIASRGGGRDKFN